MHDDARGDVPGITCPHIGERWTMKSCLVSPLTDSTSAPKVVSGRCSIGEDLGGRTRARRRCGVHAVYVEAEVVKEGPLRHEAPSSPAVVLSSVDVDAPQRVVARRFGG